MSKEGNILRFKQLCAEINREGIENLMEYLEKSDFYSAPASTRYHGAYEGGLVEHSLDVYDCYKKLQSAFPDIQAEEESILIATLFHDLCKVNFYGTEMRNRKNEMGQWEKYPAYTVAEKFCFGGHGSKSVFLLQNFIKLTPQEAIAINCHMGAWEEGDSRAIGSAYESSHFAWLVHIADEAAGMILDRKPQT